MTMSQEEWDRRQATGDWKQLPAYQAPPSPPTTFDFVAAALEAPTWDDHANDPVFVDWPSLWDDDDHTEWLYDNVFALGRGHAIYAQHKQGKSLFVLWVCAQLVTTRTDVDVIYLDYEMTRDDLRERLEDMGYGPDSDLTRLHYALLPSLPPLDTGEGAGALLELCDRTQTEGCHLFVVIDTFGRAAEGEENSNDTAREFYRWSGIALKRRQITYARLDHAGKDATKGQRGGSAKGDDVDVIWKLTQQDEGGIKLHRDAARMAWVPEYVTFAMAHEPLGFEAGAELWPAGTKPLADQLEKVGVTGDTSRRKAREVMREHGIQGENAVLGKALTYLRTRVRTTLDDLVPQTTPDQSRTTTQKPPMTRADHLTDHSGPQANGQQRTGGSPYKGTTVQPGPTSKQEITRTCRCGATATDLSGLCPGCLANPGTLPHRDPTELF